MPKISDIEETPNPNAVKFILREPVSNGVARQYGSAEQAENDSLAKSLFDVGHVVSVFYMDSMITVEKDDEGDWDELLPALAVPIRAAEAATSSARSRSRGGWWPNRCRHERRSEIAANQRDFRRESQTSLDG